MDTRYHLQYIYSNKEWYESFESLVPSNDLWNIVQARLPKGWFIKRNGVWFHAINPKIILPNQGWKIHVSARIDNCEEIIDRVSNICFQKSVIFKFALDKNMVQRMTSKGWSREAGSKVLTLYPTDENQFIEVSSLLRKELKEFNGPYILSDKRLPGSKVVHYRYGGISGESILTIKGHRQYILQTPDNRQIIDERLPFWNPPYWVNDPFIGEEDEDSNFSMALNNGRYEIHSSLSYSLYGGVYFATDLDTGSSVVIKEARPNIGVDEHGYDATDRLLKEYRILTKLEDSGFTPRPIDLFWEWEHLFLVEEFCAGSTLGKYTIKTSPFIRNSSSQNEKEEYVENIVKIWSNLAIAIDKIHQKNIVLGDISLLNIILTNEELGSIKIVDFEVAWEQGEDKPLSSFGTPGFSPIKRSGGKADDIYSLGAVYLGMIGPANVNYIHLQSSVAFNLLELGAADLGLPKKLRELIVNCLSEDFTLRPSLQNIVKCLSPEFSQDYSSTLPQKYQEQEFKIIIDSSMNYIRNVVDYSNKNRLFPADPLVFMTNPISIAHGAAGVVYSLFKITKEVPIQMIDWIQKKLSKESLVPPGLYIGTSGVAWSMWDCGYQEISLEIMKNNENNPLIYKSADIYYGATGYGLTCLYFYLKTKEQIWLDKAVQIGDWLVKTKKTDKDMSYWQDIEGKIQLGYAYGSSGIALYLLNLSQITGSLEYYRIALSAIEYDLSHLVKLPNVAMSMPRGPVGTQGMKILSQYWIEGSAGVGTALLRFWKVTQNERYLEIVKEISKDSYRMYTSAPGLFKGLSGLGNFLIDMYSFTTDELYLEWANNVGTSISFFGVNRSEGIVFPGEQGLRLSTDFATGSSGIALFLHRLINSKNGLMNFNFTLDELIL